VEGVGLVDLQQQGVRCLPDSEIVRLMAGGYSKKEIAHALETAEGSIKNHVSSILAKFGLRERTRAVLKALESRPL